MQAELEEDMLTYITSQDILKLGNWIPYRTRSRTGWQAEIRVLEEKSAVFKPRPAHLSLGPHHEAVHYATLTRATRGVTTHKKGSHLSCLCLPWLARVQLVPERSSIKLCNNLPIPDSAPILFPKQCSASIFFFL